MLSESLALQESATECVEGDVPVPVSVSVVVEGWALLVNVSVALAAPATVGLNVIVNDALFPAEIVCGKEKPPIVKTELFVLAAVTVTVPPVAVSVPVAVPLDPTTTIPNPRLDGETLSSGDVVDTPVPASETLAGEFVASLVTVSVPLNVVAAFGVNEILRVILPPAATETGNVGDARAKYLVEMEAPLIVTAFSPEFVAVTV